MVESNARKLRKRLHTNPTCDEEQVGPERKISVSGDFRKPSDGASR